MNKVLKGMLSGIPFLLLILCNNSYANGSLFGHGSEDKVQTVVISGTSGKVAKISSSNRVLGYSITGSANAIAGLYDWDGFIAEGGCLANDMKTVFFPFPKSINTQLEVMVNAATTIVTVYYE